MEWKIPLKFLLNFFPTYFYTQTAGVLIYDCLLVEHKGKIICFMEKSLLRDNQGSKYNFMNGNGMEAIDVH